MASLVAPAALDTKGKIDVASLVALAALTLRRKWLRHRGRCTDCTDCKEGDAEGDAETDHLSDLLQLRQTQQQ